MLKAFLCSLPLPLKIALGTIKTYFDPVKRKALSSIVNFSEKTYTNLNSREYRKNLKRFLAASLFSGKETAEYINYLYTDDITLLEDQTIDDSLPTIICVVKNEADKLINFFQHYSKLGKFNYVFIDNGSTDGSVDLMRKNHVRVYCCTEPFSTNRKVAWINKVYSTLPNGMWTILLDADELLTYVGYENRSFNEVLAYFERKKITTAGAVMVDMFSKEPVDRSEYINKYVFFENSFHEEKSFYFNSLYGGIREREFKFGEERIFLIKKHPVVKKSNNSMLIHCHYIYPFRRNFESEIYFALLHYKLFDSEIEKYRRIAEEGSYGSGSLEYKTYMKIFAEKTYGDIFCCSENTIHYNGSESLKKIKCLKRMEFDNEQL